MYLVPCYAPCPMSHSQCMLQPRHEPVWLQNQGAYAAPQKCYSGQPEISKATGSFHDSVSFYLSEYSLSEVFTVWKLKFLHDGSGLQHKCQEEQDHRSRISFFNLALEDIQSHFIHILLIINESQACSGGLTMKGVSKSSQPFLKLHFIKVFLIQLHFYFDMQLGKKKIIR